MFLIKYPYLQMPAVDSIIVMWETDEACQSELHVWEAFCPSCGDVQYSPEGEPFIYHGDYGYTQKIQATGLKAGKDYCYKAISKGNGTQFESDLYVFRTQPEIHSSFSFAITSETGGSRSPLRTMDLLANSIAAERPDFMLFLGDMVYNGHRKQDWDDYLFTPFRSVLSHTPFYHCAGNHEDHSVHMDHYLCPPKERYYSFTYGCAQFICLDSTALSEHKKHEKDMFRIELTEPISLDNPQISFLISALENSKALWKFVYLHYPPYFSGTWEAASLRPLCEIFENYGIDIVFTSHAIVYERSHPIHNNSIDYHNGIRYIVAGGAGACPQWFHHKKAWHTAKSRAVPHFIHVSVTPEFLEFQAIDFEGKLFDAFSLEQRRKRQVVKQLL